MTEKEIRKSYDMICLAMENNDYLANEVSLREIRKMEGDESQQADILRKRFLPRHGRSGQSLSPYRMFRFLDMERKEQVFNLIQELFQEQEDERADQWEKDHPHGFTDQYGDSWTEYPGAELDPTR